MLSQLVIWAEVFGGEGVYHRSSVFKENLLTGELCGIEGSEGEGVMLDAGGFGIGKRVMEVQRIAGYIGGKYGVGTGTETTIDKVGIGENAHQEKGQETDQKQDGDEEFFGDFWTMHRAP